MYIGDMGAKLVADIIKNYPNIGILDKKKKYYWSKWIYKNILST